MPKQSPVADEVDKAFWDAANEERLVIQYCTNCDTWQHPPLPFCELCEAGSEKLEWRPAGTTGTIHSYAVVYDTPIAVLQPDLPYNVAVIQLDEAPTVNMLSHLPGVPVDEVPIGAPVRLVFETTPGNGQKVPEWVLAD